MEKYLIDPGRDGTIRKNLSISSLLRNAKMHIFGRPGLTKDLIGLLRCAYETYNFYVY